MAGKKERTNKDISSRPVSNGVRKIILASSSPRRKEILEKSGIPFSVEDSRCEEDLSLKLPPKELAKHWAREKAKAVAKKHKDAIVIGADTIVVVNGKVLGKPRDASEASGMLKLLSGSVNTAITGFAIIDAFLGKEVTGAEETKVYFKNLTDRNIKGYVKSGEPMGKAGAYSVQGMASSLIERIEGDFYNAMGLPLSVLLEELKQFGVMSESTCLRRRMAANKP